MLVFFFFFAASLIASKLLVVLAGTPLTLSRYYLFTRPKETSFEFFSRNFLTLVHAIIFFMLCGPTPRRRCACTSVRLPLPHPLAGCISYFPAHGSGFPPKHSFWTFAIWIKCKYAYLYVPVCTVWREIRVPSAPLRTSTNSLVAVTQRLLIEICGNI